MATTTFTFTPDFGAAVAYKPRVRRVAFGDGYEQRVGDGINTGTDAWSLTFAVRTDTEANQILAFLEARGAVDAFNWTAPDGTSGVFVCDEWSRTFDRFNQSTITAKFRRVYEP